MTLHLLVESTEKAPELKTYQLLVEAAAQQGVRVRLIDLNAYSFSSDEAFTIPDNDAFYRLAVGPKARLIERFLVGKNVRSLYHSWRIPVISGLWDDTQLMLAAKLPVIPTVFLASQLKDEKLNKAVEKLGGFPVVVKITGLSHGRGVFLCHSQAEVRQVFEEFKDNPETVSLRHYIDNARHVRLAVIDDEVVDSIEYQNPVDDFRTNAGSSPTAHSVPESAELNDLCLRAVKSTGVNLAGVDFLIDANKRVFIAELNTPFNFARNYLVSGINLAPNIIKMLAR